ncbi:MAG: response regulator transcription factor [Alkalibacterium sp.]|nr:response regulator transcription factor [Alkalibacterium sp.]
MNWRVALVDDEAAQLQLLKKMLSTYGVNEKIDLEFLTFESSEAFLFHFEEDKAFDLLILDIEMGKMNGMELARHLRAHNHDIRLLFVTGYTDYIGQGYEVSAVDYVLKPVDKDKLFQVLNRFKKITPKEDTYVFVETADGMSRLSQGDIFYLEANKHQTNLYTAEGEIEAKESFSHFEKELLSDQFIKTHRSYSVNLAYVKRIGKQDVIMDDETTVPISRRKTKEVNQAFIDYYKRRS